MIYGYKIEMELILTFKKLVSMCSVILENTTQYQKIYEIRIFYS